ncbi:HD domain-containing phosphohydrolase [Propionivibrio limicola]|uniref:HD domain-containing phosphohydrolase n=1 Tax=Propionivibrio limicola TaxID=167645 RepID=UPI001291F0AB|nr:HD domain-containing phosphohydrolase [Propionivibrio limicola]
MDIRAIISPMISDEAALDEFVESLDDLAPNVERDIALLRNTPNASNASNVVASLFRSVHNIKGDGALCKVDLAVAIAHPIETVLARLRNGEISLSDTVAETILLAIDRLELAVESLQHKKPLENLRLLSLVQGLEKLALAAPDEMDACAARIIEAVTGFPPAAQHSSLLQPSIPPAATRSDNQTVDDLRFFRSLADLLEARSPLFKGRTQRLLRLALETNQLKGTPVDPVQLEAAIYMHDIGMMFLPESVWLKLDRMTTEERMALRRHPGYAAQILSRMPGWESAARIVAQHHEMPDGGGYPEGIHNGQIADGAKILAIVDAFEAVMLKHIHRGKNRSVLHAVAEINACNNQFAPEWIDPFNQVIRRTVES